MDTITIKMKLLRESGHYVIGFKGDRERWFDTRKIISFSIYGKTLSVTLQKKDWERRLRADKANDQCKSEVAVTKEKKRTTKETRNCLLCKHPFPKEKNIYICDPCKQTSNWQSGYNF